MSTPFPGASAAPDPRQEISPLHPVPRTYGPPPLSVPFPTCPGAFAAPDPRQGISPLHPVPRMIVSSRPNRSRVFGTESARSAPGLRKRRDRRWEKARFFPPAVSSFSRRAKRADGRLRRPAREQADWSGKKIGGPGSPAPWFGGSGGRTGPRLRRSQKPSAAPCVFTVPGLFYRVQEAACSK